MKPTSNPATQAGWKKKHDGLQNRFILTCESWAAACKLRVEITCCHSTLEDCTRLCQQYGLLDLDNWISCAGDAPTWLEPHRLQLYLVDYQQVRFP